VSYGLQVFDAVGNIKIDVSGRLFRPIGSVSVKDNLTKNYAYPGIVDDGTWFLVPDATGTNFGTGAKFTGFDLSILTDIVRVVYHGGNAGTGANVTIFIYRG